MSFKGIILLQSRKVKIKKINPKRTHIKWRSGLYVIDPESIRPVEKDDKIMGSEIIWFEGNPNPLSKAGISDKSGEFLDEYIIKNTLDQTGSGPRIDIGNWSESISWLWDPKNIVAVMVGGAILYGLIYGLLTGGIT